MNTPSQSVRIIASSQQTRFHVASQGTSNEIDIPGIDLAIVSESASADSGTAATKRAKGKSRGAIEILNNSDLRLKSGTCYALVGRNGAGKSTLLHALSHDLIPGLPSSVRIASLQQMEDTPGSVPNASVSSSVLDHVIYNDPVRVSLLQDIEFLSGNSDDKPNDDPQAQLHCFRRFNQQKLDQELLKQRNEAQRRSGARGAQARKELLVLEEQAAHAAKQSEDALGDIELTDVQAELDEGSRLLEQLQDQLGEMSLVDRKTVALHVLTGLGFDETMMQKPVESLSGGWRMRCALACALLQTGDLLILDEPTNFLDLLGILWLQNHLESIKSEGKRIIVLVSHDRDFVDALADETIVLRDKSLTYFRGNLSEYEADLRSRILYLSRMQEAQDREKTRVEKSIQSSIRQGKKKGDDNKLRMAKQRQKKLEDRAGMQVSATGNRFKLSRDRAGFQDSKLATIDIPTLEAGVSMIIPGPTDIRHPGALASAETVRLKFKSAAKPVLDDVSLIMHMGDRVGIMGLNGAGKSTLIKILTRTLPVTSGQLTFHPRLKLGYYSQHAVEELRSLGSAEASLTALALLLRDADGELEEQSARALLGSYGLGGHVAADVPITALSGGQLVRLALARIVRPQPNLLILDEISTHLDHHTVTALARAFDDFEGAVLLVSHDRYLVRRMIEGIKDEVGDEDDDDSDDSRGRGEEDKDVLADGTPRRRDVFILRSGKLVLQSGGVAQFVAAVEKRVAKLGGK